MPTLSIQGKWAYLSGPEAARLHGLGWVAYNENLRAWVPVAGYEAQVYKALSQDEPNEGECP